MTVGLAKVDMKSENLYLNTRIPYLEMYIYLKLRNFPLSKTFFSEFSANMLLFSVSKW